MAMAWRLGLCRGRGEENRVDRKEEVKGGRQGGECLSPGETVSASWSLRGSSTGDSRELGEERRGER